MTRLQVAASLPLYCLVCEDDKKVQMVAPGDELSRHTTACPHCSTGAPMPIYIYPPYRGDLPKDVA